MNAASPLSPSTGLLCKLASIVVHVDEMMSPTGHVFDSVTLKALLEDAEVREWLGKMDALGLTPVKRR